jgi:hypothetical protein
MTTKTSEYFIIALTFAIMIFFFLAWLFSHRARHRETMMMIEKGMNPHEHRGTNRWGLTLHKIGVVLVGIGAGSALFWIFEGLGIQSINSQPGTLAVFGICTGAALLIDDRLGNKEG